MPRHEVPVPVPPRVFVSHSSKDAALTDAVADALGRGDPKFEPLVDKECLRGGEEWPNQLHAMMAYAHAGLLLLTRAAMTRPDWVRKEAYILTWRRSLDPDFKVFYTLRDGVTREDLAKNGFGPAHLDLIQALQATEPDGIAAEIRKWGPPSIGPATPFEMLTDRLSANLKVDDKSLSQLATDLGAPPLLPWLGDQSKLGVGRVAARLLAGEFGQIRDLLGLINALKSMGLEKPALKNTMRWVAPYWLSPEAAGKFAAAIEGLWSHQQGGLAAMNGECVAQYTAKMFVYRARPFQFQCEITNFESGTHKTDADFYTARICKWLRKRELEKPYDERVEYPDDDEELMATLAGRSPFLFVPIKAPDDATLKTLRTRFPRVVFLLCTGPQLEPPDYTLPVVALEPALNVEREKREFDQWTGSLGALGG